VLVPEGAHSACSVVFRDITPVSTPVEVVHAGGAPDAATCGMSDGSLDQSVGYVTVAGESVTLALLDLSAECETLADESVTLASSSAALSGPHPAQLQAVKLARSPCQRSA
jgi:hypothetical protein